MRGVLGSALLLLFVVVGCGSDSDGSTSATVTSSTTAAPPTTSPTPTTSPPPTTSVAPATDREANLATAEAFLDNFYSFDVAGLEATLSSASPEAIGLAVYYQGWAEGGNYEIVDRMPCDTDAEASSVTCSITVEDDLLKTLDLDFNVTDTFIFTFADRELVDLDLSSDDPELVGEGTEWVFAERPELLVGVCAGMFAGGPTPGECIEAVVQGLEDFPGSP